MAFHAGRRFVAALCVFLPSIVASTSLAANLLANPGFDTDLAGWANPFSRTASWSSADAAGSAASGSALIADDLGVSNGATPLVLSQCIGGVPAATYSFGGRVRVPAGQPAFTRGVVFVLTYASGDCTGEALQIDSRGSVNAETWDFLSGEFVAGPTVHSLQLSLGVNKPSGVSADASANFDNVFIEQGTVPVGFTIGPSMSATWYDPAQSGHGIMVQLLDAASAWMCWFTFDLAGKRAWICSLGTINGDTLVFADAFVVEGGRFPPLFDPSAIVEAPWGSITVTFSGCDSGTMSWTTAADGFQSGSMPIARLTPLWGVPCP